MPSAELCLTLALIALCAVTLAAAFAVAFFRLRRRHRACRHALGIKASEAHAAESQLALARAELEWLRANRQEERTAA